MIDTTSFPYTSLARQPSCSSIAGLPRSDAYRCAGRLGDQILPQMSTSIDSRVTKRHMADHVGPGLAAATLRSPSPTPLGLSTFGWAVPAADRDGFPSARMVRSRDRKVYDGRGGFPDAFRLHPGGRPWVPVSRCAIPLRVPCGNWCPPTTGFVGGSHDVAALFFGHSSGTSISGAGVGIRPSPEITVGMGTIRRIRRCTDLTGSFTEGFVRWIRYWRKMQGISWVRLSIYPT